MDLLLLEVLALVRLRRWWIVMLRIIGSLILGSRLLSLLLLLLLILVVTLLLLWEVWVLLSSVS